MGIVMEDSPRELRRHLPIWLRAHGRILITGLGLGYVMRGLLASPLVEHVDVVEIDADILSVVGSEFATNPRVTLHHGDALQIAFADSSRWDFAWHDIWTEQNKGLHEQHTRLLMKFDKQVTHQGAWQMPRDIKRLSSNNGLCLLGAARVA
jgi:spermidine synthase